MEWPLGACESPETGGPRDGQRGVRQAPEGHFRESRLRVPHRFRESGLRGAVSRGAAEHPGHGAEVGLDLRDAGLVDLPAADGEGAGEGDADAADPAEIAVGVHFFVAVDIADGDLAALGVVGHVEEGADDLAVGQGDFDLVAALAVDGGGAEELDPFAPGQRVEEVAAGGGVADEVGGFRGRHGGGFWDTGCGIRGAGCGIRYCVELPGVLAVVGHDDAAPGCFEDDFAEVGLFLEGDEGDAAPGEVEGAFEADAFDLRPSGLAGEILPVVVAEDVGEAVIEAGGVHGIDALDGLAVGVEGFFALRSPIDAERSGALRAVRPIRPIRRAQGRLA